MKRLASLIFACGIALLFSLPQSSGYSLEVHKDFYDFAFGKGHNVPVAPPNHAGLDGFRRFFYDRAAKNPEFKQKFPTFASFDSAAFKHFMALNPNKDVYGFDRTPKGPVDVRTAWREASVYPDTDNRNQNRTVVVNDRVVIGPDGKTIPYDPKTLYFGARIGTASQFDAHGAMTRTPKSDSYWKAVTDPENFSLNPREQLGSAPEFSQNYTDLAVLARAWGQPGSEWLAISFGGNNFHGIEDLGNQIHTTLVGSPWFFYDATKTIAKSKVKGWFSKIGRGIKSLFGKKSKKKNKKIDITKMPPLKSVPLKDFQDMAHRVKTGKPTKSIDPRLLYAVDKLPSDEVTLVSVGTLILDNFHRLLEGYFQESYLHARVHMRNGKPHRIHNDELRKVFARAKAGDAAFEAELRAALAGKKKGQPEFARIIAEKMIEKSAPEAAPIYTSIRAISDKDLRGEKHYQPDAGDRPMDFIRKKRGKHVDRIFRLHGKAFARVVTALRLWHETFDKKTKGLKPGSKKADKLAQSTVDRIVQRQLDYHKAAKKRRIAYLKEVAKKVGNDPSKVKDPLEGVDPLATQSTTGITGVLKKANKKTK